MTFYTFTNGTVANALQVNENTRINQLLGYFGNFKTDVNYDFSSDIASTKTGFVYSAEYDEYVGTAGSVNLTLPVESISLQEIYIVEKILLKRVCWNSN